MNSGKLKAVFLIIVFLLALALVVHWALELDAKKHAADIPADEPQETELMPQVEETPAPEQPQQNAPAPTWAPAPTPVPANRPAPTQAPAPQPQQNTPAPAPTPVPTPAPKPAGQNLGSGSFRSETGTGLDLICDWSAVSVEGNKAEITLTISIDSYTLYLNELTDRIHLRVGGQTGSMTQPALSYEGGKTNTVFGSKTFTVDLVDGGSYPVAVEWHYNGAYHDTPLDVIECGGTISF